MSFILDALKKSEVERQRQAIPGLMDVRTAPPRARFPAWAAALAVLLAVNLAVLAVVLTRSGWLDRQPPRPAPRAASSAPAPATAAAATATAPSGTTAPAAAPAPSVAALPAAGGAAATRDHFSPMDPAPQYAPEIPAADLPPPTATQSSRAAHHLASLDSGGQHASRTPDPVLDDDKSDNEVLPSISELNLSGQQALPELHLDVHVYATKPAERFVYINMHKYREGDTLQEGPLVEHIRRDGVVLDYRGLRFVLPRQQ
ncbi:MAG TPA: general secretion pathway protein GspB [Steroidobacteraceae bacterium]|nr:general secretion pathway protein GspB [Steroidobacteraceae bacterium]